MHPTSAQYFCNLRIASWNVTADDAGAEEGLEAILGDDDVAGVMGIEVGGSFL